VAERVEEDEQVGMAGRRPLVVRGDDYDQRFQELAQTGVDVHGEASFVKVLGRRSVLDAGCGTGRVAIELAHRGMEVVGIDADAAMLATARRRAPELDWRLADLTTADLSAESFDVVLLAGNVMIFLAPGTEAAVVANLASALRPGGLLVAGFQLDERGLTVEIYDDLCRAGGLSLVQRYATWDREPWRVGGGYAVSTHALAGDGVLVDGEPERAQGARRWA